jgi:hypothetical protein
MTGRYQQHEAIDLATLDAFQLAGNLFVNARRFVARVGVLREAN